MTNKVFNLSIYLFIYKQKVKAESPFILAKACELFIMEITIRSWLRTENSRRRSLEKSDITNAILDSKEYGFLTNKIIIDNNQQVRTVFNSRKSTYIQRLNFNHEKEVGNKP